MDHVSELLTLKIENCRLKLAQLQEVGNKIAAEQVALIEQARAEVGAAPGSLFNTETRQFQAAPAPLSTPKVRQMKRSKVS